jgi:plasmid rolling circle replication initiator protein Rep
MTETKSKPSVKKAAVSEKTAKKAAPKTRTKKTANQERYELIQRTAYFIAEHNGFVGDPHAFWAEAEAQISKMKS